MRLLWLHHTQDKRLQKNKLVPMVILNFIIVLLLEVEFLRKFEHGWVVGNDYLCSYSMIIYFIVWYNSMIIYYHIIHYYLVQMQVFLLCQKVGATSPNYPSHGRAAMLVTKIYFVLYLQFWFNWILLL